jgi:hypothetical protein
MAMTAHRFCPACAAMLLIALALPVHADDNAIVDRWYAALLAADRARLSDLLADDARIRLEDLGIEQNKTEFIASMDEWETAVAGAAIRHRIDKSEGGVVTVIVCYDFPANDLLTRETFATTGEQITASSQGTIAESCDDY